MLNFGTPATAITSFTGQYAFLSNFHHVRVSHNCVSYISVEHAYQAAKIDLAHPKADDWHAKILAEPLCGKVKRIGRRVQLRADWDEQKLDIMYVLVSRKFSMINPELRASLLSTGVRDLIEGNTWGDTYWGVCKGVGENHLGRILMNVRHEILTGKRVAL